MFFLFSLFLQDDVVYGRLANVDPPTAWPLTAGVGWVGGGGGSPLACRI